MSKEEETNVIRISKENYYKLLKIQEDRQLIVNQNAHGKFAPRKVTLDEVLFELMMGKW